LLLMGVVPTVVAAVLLLSPAAASVVVTVLGVPLVVGATTPSPTRTPAAAAA